MALCLRYLAVICNLKITLKKMEKTFLDLLML